MVWLNTIRNPLSADLLATFIALSLPKDVTPQFKIPFDTIILAIYIKMLTVGFRLVGLREDY